MYVENMSKMGANNIAVNVSAPGLSAALHKSISHKLISA